MIWFFLLAGGTVTALVIVIAIARANSGRIVRQVGAEADDVGGSDGYVSGSASDATFWSSAGDGTSNAAGSDASQGSGADSASCDSSSSSDSSSSDCGSSNSGGSSD